MVDNAIIDLIDYVDPSDIPKVLNFIDNIQKRLVKTPSTTPEGGTPFQGIVRVFVVERYTFLYEYHPDINAVHVLDMIAPGQDWQ